MIKRYCLLIFLLVVFIYGRPPKELLGSREYQIKIHDANQIEMCVSNYGKFGQHASSGAGCWWPKYSYQNYIYGAGPWFGTIDNILGDTLVSIGYGPHGYESEFVPGLQDMSSDDPNAVIFMYPVLWPPPAEVYPMAPQDALSYQDSWCVFNDLDINAHMPGDTRPIGLEVYQTIYVWDLSSTRDIIFLKYEIKNVSESLLTDCFFGICADNDIGYEGGVGNDIISGIVSQWYVIDGESLLVDDLGYQWQEIEEPGWISFPGAIAFDYLQSPWDLQEGQDKDNDGILDQYERDSTYFWNNLPDSLWDIDLDGTPDWRDPSQIPQIGMSSFKRFSRASEPDQDNERYLTMAGYDFVTGAYEPFDTVPPEPADHRFLQCSGPFDLAADSTATITVSIILADWYDQYLLPDTALVITDKTAQLIYNKNWTLPRPPSPPKLTCIPQDAKIILVWDNNSEHQADPYYDLVSDPQSPIYDPFYRQYDFEGYRIWKQNAGDWQILTSCDMYNDIVFEDTTQADSIRIKATNTGLYHVFTDTIVRNGFEYFYAVTAFDYNYVKLDTIDSLGQPMQIPIPIWFESGKISKSAYPRRDPANFVPGVCSVEVLSGNELLADNIVLSIAYPLDMVAADMYLDYEDVVYDSVIHGGWYSVYLRDTDGSNIDSLFALVGNNNVAITHAFSVVNGISVEANLVFDSLPADQSIFKTVTKESGTYPDSLIVTSLPGAWASYFAFWAYRGNDYQIEWYSTTNHPTNANSVRVTDVMTGEDIPYRAYDPDVNHLHDSQANGWCFQSHLEISDTLVLNGTPPATRNTKFLYINGGLIGLKRGGPLMPGDPVPSVSDDWLAEADEHFLPAPVSASFALHSVPAYFDTLTQLDAFNVKVVPSPYIIHNEWQTSFRQRRLKFINLPADCTVRIFNLNGELVRTLLHHHTLVPGEGEQEVTNSAGGDEWWDLLSDTKHIVKSGIYIFHIQSAVGEQVGKFAIIR